MNTNVVIGTEYVNMQLKKKQSKADFLREWAITDPKRIKSGFTWLRYKQPPEKGIYWYWFSLHIRQRDVEAYGTCISCGKPITIDTCDAGHFIPASSCGRDLLFDEYNVNAECARCNAWDEGHLFGYEQGLIKRYGEGIPKMLKKKYFAYKNNTNPVKDWKKDVYATKIKLLPSYQQAKMQDVQQQ